MANNQSRLREEKLKPSSGRLRLLSRELLFWLILVVGFVSILAILLNFFYLSKQAERSYGQKSAQYLAYISGTLEVPLWNIEAELVRKICSSFAVDKEISYLQVEDDEGRVIYEKQSGHTDEVIKSQKVIMHSGIKVGTLKLGVAPLYYEQMRQQVLQAGLTTLLLILAALFLSVSFLLHRMLGQPLKALVKRTEDLASGEYQAASPDFIYRELKVINDGLESMATQIKNREQVLRQSEGRLRYMLETSPIAVRIAASGGRQVLFANPSYARLINVNNERVIGTDPKSYYLNPKDYEEVLGLLAKSEHINNRLIELNILDIGRKWVLASYLPIQYEGEEAVLGWFYDITELKQAQEKLLLSARVFAEALEGIIITDANGLIIDVNPTFCEITGYSREESIGKNPRVLKSDRQKPEFYVTMWNDLKESGYWHGEIWNRRKNGELYAVLLTISTLRDGYGKTMHYVGLYIDITNSKSQQHALEMMAHYDVLTRLPNRALFADRFIQAIARTRRDNSFLAVCYLDLDGFKKINDTHGHDAGDQLLISVAERIKSSLREEDTAARFGGDEFVLLLGDIHTIEQCECALDRFHQAIAQPYLLNGQTYNIAASTGFTLYPLDDADADVLLRHADQAMYQAKLLGRSRYHLFDASHDQEVQTKREKLALVEQAFTRQEFCLYYQPKIDMKRGEIIGAEALIRWMHPERGIVPPLEFLPVIEDTALDIQIGNWVIEQALQQLAIWLQAGLDLQISINVSPHHLQDPNFLSQLDAALSRHPDIPSHRLQLEILESSVLYDLSAITEIILGCRDSLGVNIALDDFGTGYSSLTHLRHLPANTIKIDQTFVRNMIDDPNDFAIVEGVISLAEAFQRDVIAEGVESREHGLMLLGLGCTKAQGYGIARPMPAKDFVAWAKDYCPDAKWLDYARQHHSFEETSVMQLIIENNHWVARLKECLNTSEGKVPYWPIMNHEECHSGRRIKYLLRENIFDASHLARIDVAHADLHNLGNKLKWMHHDGHVEEALAHIPELENKCRDVESMLHELI